MTSDLQKSFGIHKFRKKPVVIEAMRLNDYNAVQLAKWCGGDYVEVVHRPVVLIYTLEGTMEASEGDWIVKGVKDEFYPVKPDIFEATYEPA